MSGFKPRHVFWREQYRAHRYARHLTRPELNKRIRDILLNLLGGEVAGNALESTQASAV
jgi:hypothetical protein